jgi:hypothetical protein
VAELDFTIQQDLLRLGAGMELPVIYDDLTPGQRTVVREEYARRQNGICPHCWQPLLGDPPPAITRLSLDERRFGGSFLKWPQHLHHNHRTGLTIGTYHARCNAVLAQYHNE